MFSLRSKVETPVKLLENDTTWDVHTDRITHKYEAEITKKEGKVKVDVKFSLGHVRDMDGLAPAEIAVTEGNGEPKRYFIGNIMPENYTEHIKKKLWQIYGDKSFGSMLRL